MPEPLLSFTRPGRRFPTAPGATVGVIARGEGTATVQCAVCLVAATGKPIFATGWALFARDEGSGSGPLPYRRCSECRSARRHPDAEAGR